MTKIYRFLNILSNDILGEQNRLKTKSSVLPLLSAHFLPLCNTLLYRQ